ncbi:MULTISPECIES: hypothetical protein [unclassified Streptomyces]|uniref:hypothetical protein n=1 Tax=unclassified Streptomyces TaxID=2593676 RepID=UPI0033A72AED
MAEAAGPNTDSPGEWAERLGWTYGLIAPDDVVRGAALARLDAARAEAQEALARYNQAWVQASRTGAEPLFCEPEIVTARELYDDAGSRSLPEAMWFAPYADDIRMSPQLPFALLFLEWEARYPQEWQVHAKAWGTKQALIRRVAVGGRSDVVTEKLIDLVELVVQRAYRCKDREYVRVARAVDGRVLSNSARPRSSWFTFVRGPLGLPFIGGSFSSPRSWVVGRRREACGGAGHRKAPARQAMACRPHRREVRATSGVLSSAALRRSGHVR